MEGLSERQQQVYDFIKVYNGTRDICPSISDVAEGLKLAPTTAATYVENLKEKGYVTSDYGVPRSLRVIVKEGIA